MSAKKVLGKGLNALLQTENTGDKGVNELKITEIEPNVNQPRKKFDDEKLRHLSDSINQHGMVQPIIVKRENDIYRIIAGERRWRAARLAGLDTVPVVIKDITNKEIMEIALIENLQREDLNPIEEAEAFEKLMSEYKITQEQLSQTVGKSRSSIANSVRLLSLTEKVRSFLINGEISSGHARALLAIEDKNQQEIIAQEIITKNLNVRETEKVVKNILTKKSRSKSKQQSKDENFIDIEEKLKSIFGTQVKLIHKNKTGKISIEYYSLEDLDRILEIINSLK